MLLFGWIALPGAPWLWTIIGLTAIAFPWLFSTLLALIRPPRGTSWRAYYAAVGRDAIMSLHQLGLALVFLPHQAVISADAIVRTLWRLLISRRNLLEWQTASQIERAALRTGLEIWLRMASAVAIAVLVGGLVVTIAALGMPP